MRRARLAGLLVVVAALAAGGCASAERGMPRCGAHQRLAIVAQSVPTAAYVPCIDELPAGWEVTSFEVDDAGSRLELRSDRADEPVVATLSASCRRGGSSPIAPIDVGVRSYLRVDAVSPDYAGRFFDVFPGGCLVTEFSLERGPHVALLDELRGALELYPRRALRIDLEAELGITLDP